jgi:hypothetical protein
MLGFSTLRRSNAESPHHVYELRLYQWFIKAVFDDGSETPAKKFNSAKKIWSWIFNQSAHSEIILWCTTGDTDSG